MSLLQEAGHGSALMCYIALSPRSAQNYKCFSSVVVLSHPTGKNKSEVLLGLLRSSLPTEGDSIIIVFCPQAAWQMQPPPPHSQLAPLSSLA